MGSEGWEDHVMITVLPTAALAFMEAAARVARMTVRPSSSNSWCGGE